MAARYLFQNRPRQYWSNSFATAQVIESLTQFSKIYSSEKPNVHYEVLLDGKKIGSGSITTLTKEVVVPIPLDETTPQSQLSVVKSGTGELYSTLVVDEFRTARDLEPVQDTLTIERSYKGDFLVGDVVEVRLHVSGLPKGSRYLVVEDVLPAGLVPINPIFRNEYETEKNTFANYFEGRDYPSAQEVTTGGMVTSFDYIDDGDIEFTYKARVVSRGTYYTPPATAFLMYSPDVFGRTATTKVVIDDSPFSQAVDGAGPSLTTRTILLAAIIVGAMILLAFGIRRYAKGVTPPPTP